MVRSIFVFPQPAGPPAAAWLFVVLFAAVVSSGCGRSASTTGTSGNTKTKLKVAYLGLTCEAPIYVAYEQGFFAEQGLDVELVKTDWDGLREGLGLGRFDANHTLIMYL